MVDVITRPPLRRATWKKAFSGISTFVLIVVMTMAGGSSAANAAPDTFNPFNINQDFTIVAFGNSQFNNAEIEGSVAVLGSISSGNQNGYIVVHNVAGEADYTVPSIDGVPVRILAERFTGAGGFDIANHDGSGTIPSDSPEANAVVKFADIDDLTGSARGGGSGNAAGQDFLRLTNGDGGIVDLKSVPFADADVTDYKTQKPVSDYFGDYQAHIGRTNQCLIAMYSPDSKLSNPVTVADEGGMAFPGGFSTDRPNVIDYGEIAGKTIKMDRADGYKPTANAPLIIRVPAGTTQLGQLNFEGWSSQAGAQQTLARHIMLDLSEVTGQVTVDGLELGAIWAPNADLLFNSGITTNGQWLANGVSTAGGGEIHHHPFIGNLPCGDLDPTDPTDPDPTDPTDPTDPDPTDPDPTDPGSTDEGAEVSSDHLPKTGADFAWPLLAAALSLIAAGAGTLALRRRKQV